MRKSAPIEVVVHYPKTEEGWKSWASVSQLPTPTM